jgi:membrane-associated protease RseP (regulator of RpoE activity)
MRPIFRTAALTGLLAAVPALSSAVSASSNASEPMASGAMLVQQKAQKGWLGITIEEDAAKGRIVVVEVVPNSPAHKAGLKPGDALLALGKAPIQGFDAFVDAMSKGRVGQRFVFHVQRGDKKMPLDVVLGARPGAKVAKAASAQRTSSRTPKAQPKQEARPGYLGVEIEGEKDRVAVTGVVPGSAASIAGLKVGDRIVAANGKKVADMDALIAHVQKTGAGNALSLEVLRRGDGSEWKKMTVKAVLGAAMPAPRAAIQKAAEAKKPAPKKQVAKKQAAKKQATKKQVAKKSGQKKVTQQRRIMMGGAGGMRMAMPAAKWMSDYEKAVAASKKTKRPLIIKFGAKWARPSQMLDRSFSSPRLAPWLSQTVLLALDTDKHGKLADKFGVHGLPHVVIQDAKGKVVGTFTGYLSEAELGKRLSGFLGKLGVKPKAVAMQRAPGRTQPKAGTRAAGQRAAGMALTPQMMQRLQRQMAEIARKEAQKVLRAELGRAMQQMRKQMAEMRKQLADMKKDGGQAKDLDQMMEKMLRMQEMMLKQMQKAGGGK